MVPEKRAETAYQEVKCASRRGKQNHIRNKNGESSMREKPKPALGLREEEVALRVDREIGGPADAHSEASKCY